MKKLLLLNIGYTLTLPDSSKKIARLNVAQTPTITKKGYIKKPVEVLLPSKRTVISKSNIPKANDKNLIFLISFTKFLPWILKKAPKLKKNIAVMLTPGITNHILIHNKKPKQKYKNISNALLTKKSPE